MDRLSDSSESCEEENDSSSSLHDDAFVTRMSVVEEVVDKEEPQEEVEDEFKDEDRLDQAKADRLAKMKEYQPMLEDYNFTFEEDPPDIIICPQLEQMRKKVSEKIRRNFNMTTVLAEIDHLYDLLNQAKKNEDQILAKLNRRENEVKDMAESIKKDPRVRRVLLLAEKWRLERDEFEQRTNDCGIALMEAQADIKSMEAQIANCQAQRKRALERLEKAQELEQVVDKLEEQAIERGGLVGDLRVQIGVLEEALEYQIKYCKKTLTATETRLSALPGRMIQAIASADKQNQFLASRLTTCQQTLREMSVEVASLHHIESISKSYLRMVIQSLRGVKQDVRRRENVIRNFNAINIALQQEKSKLEANLKTVQAKLRAESASNAEHVKELEQQKAQVNQLRTTLFHHEKKLLERGTEITKLKKRLRFLEVERATQEKAHVQLYNENKVCGRERKVLQQKFVLEESAHLTAVAKLRSARTDLRAATVAAANLMSGADQMHDFIAKNRLKLETCENNMNEYLSLIKHLKAVVKARDETIHIKDTQFDTLLVSTDELGHLLKLSERDIVQVQQRQMRSNMQNKGLLELIAMMQHMIKFTEVEKVRAVSQTIRVENQIVLLQKQQMSRMVEMLQLQKDVNVKRAELRELSRVVDLQKHEIMGLMDSIRRAQLHESQLKNDAHVARIERNVFGSMVIQRNTEIQLLKKKMDILNTVLERGFSSYNARGNDMTILKIEIRNLRHKVAKLDSTKSMATELRGELIFTARGIQEERCKRKAVEDMKMPQPHPNRYLMNSYPSEYEKVIKIQGLQRLLLRKVSTLAQQEQTIMQKNKDIHRLVTLLDLRPTPGCMEKIKKTQAGIKDKDRKIKALLAEVKMLTFDVEDAKKKADASAEEMKKLKEELAKLKRKLAFRAQPPVTAKPKPGVEGSFMIHSKSKTTTRTVTKRWMTCGGQPKTAQPFSKTNISNKLTNQRTY